jgi:DNA-binding response OmpR family regulator
MFADLKILLIEDNEHLREEMLDFLARPGWTVHGIDCGEELNIYLGKETPDLVLLDVNLPYEDGYSITSRLRTTHPDIGIVLLTARVRPIDRATGYKAGADVYLTKPTNTEELIAVIENIGRRLKRREIRYFILDRLAGKLHTPQGKACALTHSELRLIELLALSTGREVDVDQILSNLSGKEDKTATKESLAALISRLRSKCKTELEVDNLIAATRGLGYRLTVPLQLK